MSKALLNSISHELRTPISAITAAASALADFQPGEQPALQKTLAGEIQESAARLNRLVGNLLDMTRLESGKVKPRLEWCDVADLVNVALRRNETELARPPGQGGTAQGAAAGADGFCADRAGPEQSSPQRRRLHRRRGRRWRSPRRAARARCR